MNSIDWYNTNASRFVDTTVHNDLSTLYEPFLKAVQSGCHILDAGCGSGRDSLYFLQHGYQVTAFDGSEEMVKSSTHLTGLAVLHLRFEDLNMTCKFDAIWACASLLHVPKASIDDVLDRLCQALKPKGVFFVSVKYGEEEQVRNGRLFSDYTKKSFLSLIERHPALQIDSLWTSMDTRPGLESQRWLDAIMIKV